MYYTAFGDVMYYTLLVDFTLNAMFSPTATAFGDVIELHGLTKKRRFSVIQRNRTSDEIGLHEIDMMR